MARYIDADKLYKEVELLKAQSEENIKNAGSMSARMIATTQLAERDNFAGLVCWMPTAEVFNVERCKNCASYHHTADVVPKSEVDEIAEELSDTIVMKDEL